MKRTMKSLVLYYSQSGNTEKVAKAIQSGIISATGQCDIAFLDLKQTKVSSLLDYDLIGIGAPAFGFLEPGNVATFLKRLKRLTPLAGKDSFIFTTHAGHPGNIFPSMEGKLKRAGLRLLGGFGCDGQYFLPHRITPWFTDGHPDQTDLKQAADFGREMADKKEQLDKGKAVPLAHFPWLRGGIYRDIAILGKESAKIRFTFDREQCAYPKCRLCVDKCPMDCINLDTDPVVVYQGRGCIDCSFCEQVCPTGAVTYPEGYLPGMSQFFSGIVHKYNYPEWFQKAETQNLEHRGTLYRRIGEPVDIDDPNKAAFKALPKRPRVPKKLIAPASK